MKKPLTNDQMIRKLLKDCNMWDFMILRERLVKIAEMTLTGIQKCPSDYDNPIYNHTFYVATCNKIIKHVGFEEKDQEHK